MKVSGSLFRKTYSNRGKGEDLRVDSRAFGEKVGEAGSEGPDEDWMYSSVSLRGQVGIC